MAAVPYAVGAHYRGLDLRNRILWIDISRETDALAEHGIDHTAAMQRLHVVDEQGKVWTGVRAFVVVWWHLPGYRHLARFVERFGLVSFLDRLYSSPLPQKPTRPTNT